MSAAESIKTKQTIDKLKSEISKMRDQQIKFMGREIQVSDSLQTLGRLDGVTDAINRISDFETMITEFFND